MSGASLFMETGDCGNLSPRESHPACAICTRLHF